ncbi:MULTISPECIES: hypothetical protein, partial [unclassified Aeromonas]
MYKVMKIDDERACLFDTEVMQPTFLSLKFCIEQLHQKSVNYQISTLTNIMYFKEYWLAKEGANKRGNSSRLTQSFHFFMFEP